MAENSQIQWTKDTWNPWHGCHKISDGCKFCYMFRDKERYGQEPNVVLRSKSTFNEPLKWHKKLTGDEPLQERLVFTCSWSDFFIEEADEWRDEAWQIIKNTPKLVYQILTKRPENIAARLPKDWGNGYPNVWLGVSVENQKAADSRIPYLLETRAAIRFLSVEPLLEKVELRHIPTGHWAYGQVDVMSGYLQGDQPDEMYDYDADPSGWTRKPATEWERGPHGIDWVILGGESGNENGKYKYRPIEIEEFQHVVNQCTESGVPIFVKQMGTYLGKKLKLKDSHGGDITEWPECFQVRRFPKTSHL